MYNIHKGGITMNDDLNCNHGCIHNVSIFKNLSINEKVQIMDRAITKKYQKGEMIFSTLDSAANLWVINQGKVKLTKISPEGKEQIIRILYKGEFLGELSLFSDEKMTTNAFALENSEICVIRGKDIINLIHSKPDIAVKFLAAYTKRIKEAEAMIENIGIYDIEQRIIKTLLEELTPNNDEITLPFSKSDFASIIGTTRETLSRKLAKFQDLGIIKLKGQRQIIILDKNQLENILYK
jgi:CRP/FNR family transcriptional regulator